MKAYDKSKLSYEQLAERNAWLENELAQIGELRRGDIEDKRNMRDSMTKVSEERDELKQKVKQLEEVLQSPREHEAKLTADNERMTAQINELIASNHELRMQREEISKVCDHLQTHGSLPAEGGDDRMARLEAYNEDLSQLCRELETRLASMEVQEREQGSELVVEGRCTALEEAEEEVKRVSSRCANLVGQLQALREDIKTGRKREENLIETNDRLKESLSQAEECNKALTAKNRELSERCAHLEQGKATSPGRGNQEDLAEVNEKLDTRNQKQADQIDDLTVRNWELLDRCAYLESRLGGGTVRPGREADLANDSENLNVRVQELEVQIDDLTVRYWELADRHSKLLARNKELEECCARLNPKLELAEAQIG